MNYEMTTPCSECPFLKKHRHAFPIGKLRAFATGEFPCHKTAVVAEDCDGVGDETTTGYVPKDDGSSQHCAGALIFNEKREQPHQMMRICERIGLYDRTKLNMKALVR